MFGALPGGYLSGNEQEDGNTDWDGMYYGLRTHAGRAANPINRYENADGTVNQASGCLYKGEDFPGFNLPLGGPDPALPGDRLNLQLFFRGIISGPNGSAPPLREHDWTVSGMETIP